MFHRFRYKKKSNDDLNALLAELKLKKIPVLSTHLLIRDEIVVTIFGNEVFKW
jgi:hypothetical protein